MTPRTSFTAGARVGGYLIDAPLGAGGMGRVFVATDDKLQRKVALKVLPPEDADDEGRARFLREAQALARVRHRNVVQVFASGVDDGTAWMALELVVGDALGALIDAGPVDEETALSLCAQAAHGLAAVHEVGVVHRDVKPDNLLLDEQGVVRVLDFGVALVLEGAGQGGFVTQKGVAIGTPHFMAPEQARGSAIDARADAWGLGATLFALLTGKPPFFEHHDEPDLDILARVLRERAPDVRARASTTSAATAALLGRLLEPDPKRRLADMAQIARAFEAIADAVAAGEVAPLPPMVADAAGDVGLPTAAAEEAAAPAFSSAPAARAPRGWWLAALALALVFSAVGALVARALTAAAESPSAPGAATASSPKDPSALVERGATRLGHPEEQAAVGASAPGQGIGGPEPLADAPANPSLEGAAAAAERAAQDEETGFRTSSVATDGTTSGTAPSPAASSVNRRSPDGQEVRIPSADELAARVLAAPGDRAPLWELVGRDDEQARAAVEDLARSGGAAADAVVAAIGALESRHHLGALRVALLQGNRERALGVIALLVALRPFEALAILEEAAEDHADERVRAKAAAARAELFRVEGQ